MRKISLRLLLFRVIFLFLHTFSSPQTAHFQTAGVKRVVDGNTLLLIAGERVRLIGVDIHGLLLFNEEKKWSKKFAQNAV